MGQVTKTRAPIFAVAQAEDGNGYVGIAVLAGLAVMDPGYPAEVDEIGDPHAILTKHGLAHLDDLTPGQVLLWEQTAKNAKLRAVLAKNWWPAYRAERAAGNIEEIDAAWEPLKEVE